MGRGETSSENQTTIHCRESAISEIFATVDLFRHWPKGILIAGIGLWRNYFIYAVQGACLVESVSDAAVSQYL